MAVLEGSKVALGIFRQNFPQYADMDDQTFARAIAAKFPQYAADLGPISGMGQVDPSTAGLPAGYTRTGREGSVDVIKGTAGDAYRYDRTTGAYTGTSSGQMDPSTAGLPQGYRRIGEAAGWDVIEGPEGIYDLNSQTGQWQQRNNQTTGPPGTPRGPGGPGAPRGPGMSAPTSLGPTSQPGGMPAGTSTQPGTLGPAKPSTLNLEALSPQEKAYLDTIYQQASSEATAALTDAAETAAAARGFRISDSPIGNAYIQEQAKQQGLIAAQKAASGLSLGQESRQLRESSRQFDVGEERNRYAVQESARQAQAALELAKWKEQETARQFQEQMTLSRGQFTESARQAQEAMLMARADLGEKQRQFDTQAALSTSQLGEAQRQFNETAGLARAGFEENQTMGRWNAAEDMRRFQEGLRQQDFTNALTLAQAGGMFSPTAGGGEGGAAGGGNNQGAIASQALTNYFAALGNRTGGTTTSSMYEPGGMDYWKMINGTISSLGSVAGAAAMSTARVKKDIEPYDADEYDRALGKLRDTPITRWRYFWEPDDGRLHTGPILELSPEEIKADDMHLDLLSYAGLQHAGLKALDRKVNRLTLALMEAP